MTSKLVKRLAFSAAALAVVLAAYVGWRIVAYPSTSSECIDVASRLYFDGTTRPALAAAERQQLNAAWARCRETGTVDTTELLAWQAANLPKT